MLIFVAKDVIANAISVQLSYLRKQITEIVVLERTSGYENNRNVRKNNVCKIKILFLC